MKEIILTRDKIALVDDEDYERLSKKTWTALCAPKNWYATHYYRVGSKVYAISMHRFILNITGNIQIDHIDRNGLNNQRHNLRFATHQQNLYNRATWSSSGFKGVYKCKHSGKILISPRSGSRENFK